MALKTYGKAYSTGTVHHPLYSALYEQVGQQAPPVHGSENTGTMRERPFWQGLFGEHRGHG